MAETEAALSPRQCDLIKNTWALVSPDLERAGLIMFNKLFVIAPDLKHLFPFSDEELDDNHPGLKKHALQVMESIDLAIGLLDDPDELKEILLTLGIVHNMKNVKLDSFAPVGEALIYALETGLKEKFTVEVKEAWVALYKAVQTNMTQGMEEGVSA